jgi:predicted PurR-regulated permease PerM
MYDLDEMPRKADEGWLSRERILALVLLAVTAVAFYFCYRLTQPFLPALTWALALAVVARPMHEWIAARVGNADVAAGLSVGLVAVLLIGPSLFVLQRLTREAAVGMEHIQQQAESGAWRDNLERHEWLEPAVRWVERNIDVRGEIPTAVNRLIGDATAVLGGSIWAVTQLLLTLFTLYFFFRDRPAVLRGVRSLLPLAREEADRLFRRVADTVHATVYGTLVVALVQGTLGGLMFWWLGLPAPLTWGLIMALLAVVPYLGAFVVWAPAAAVLALQGDWGDALLLTGWGVVIVGFIDNLLYPLLVGQRMRLHTLVVLVAIIGGLAVFGASGVVLGPVVVAVALALVDVWRQRTADGHAADEEGAGKKLIEA